MSTAADSVYDHYFALGYETREQVDVFLKYNPPPTANEVSAASLHSATDSVYSGSATTAASGTYGDSRTTSGGTTGGTSGYEIGIPAPPAAATLLNKFQVDFEVMGLPAGLDPYNPDEIDIAVKFVHGTTVLYTNAYWGTEYIRNLCALPDPTYVPGIPTTSFPHPPPIFPGVTNMPPCVPATPTNQFYYGNINYDTPDGDPGYLTSPVAGWHVRFAPPAIGVWSYSFLISVSGGPASDILGPFSSFSVGPSANPGYVGATNRNFKFGASGNMFIPLGVNTQNSGADIYNRAQYAVICQEIGKDVTGADINALGSGLAQNMGNYLRLFCTYEKLGIERGDPDGTHPTWGAGKYDYGQDRAFDLDSIVDTAAANGIYLQLILDSPLFFSPLQDLDTWKNNPYKPFIDAAYTGIFASTDYTTAQYNKYAPGLFFTDPVCQLLYKRKLRYIMARWGYATNIFAFEFFNEVTNPGYFFMTIGPPTRDQLITWQGTDYIYIPGTTPMWQAPGYIQVSTWVNEMIAYCKDECYQGTNHMFTISAPGSESNMPNPYLFHAEYYRPDDFVNLMNIDFYTYHFYDTSAFIDYRINFLANRARLLYPTKPFILGEFDISGSDDNGGTICSPYAGQPAGTNIIYATADFHSALFASILSGCAGAIVSWTDYSTQPWMQQLAYYPPLLSFLAGEDLDWNNCIAICNPCPLNTYYTAMSLNGAIPPDKDNYQFNDLPEDIFNRTIFASGYVRIGTFRPEYALDPDLIEVFALQYNNGPNRGKIIGWVKNRNNYWYNLPHNGSGDATCTDPNPPHAVTPNAGYNPDPVVLPIYDVEITISGVCNGTYRLDFWGVYPDWPAGSGSAGAGVLSSVTVTVVCNTITFSVPYDLQALQSGAAPLAPDYGFKLTPINLTWGYGYLGIRPAAGHGAVDGPPTGLQPFSVGEGGNLVVYANIERELMIYTRESADVYTWGNENLSFLDINFRTSADCVVAVGANNGQIFYKGTDNLLHCAYPDGRGGWGHVNFGFAVDGDIGCAADGGRVFFRGNDGDLHFLFWNDLWRPMGLAALQLY